MSGNIDLVKIFSAVAETMVENQTSLNKADEYNQDHGDHMVEIFDLVSGAMKAERTTLSVVSVPCRRWSRLMSL